jgi:hypothetical protein
MMLKQYLGLTAEKNVTYGKPNEIPLLVRNLINKKRDNQLTLLWFA